MGALVAMGGAAMVSLSVPLPKSVEVSDIKAPQTPVELEAGAQPETDGTPDADLVETAPRSPAGDSAAGADQPAEFDTTAVNKPAAGTEASALEGGDSATAVQSPDLQDTVQDTGQDTGQDTANAGAPDSALQPLPEPASEAVPTVNTDTAAPVPLPEAPATTQETTQAPVSAEVQSPQIPQISDDSGTGLTDVAALPDAPSAPDSGLGNDATQPTPLPEVSDLTPEEDSIAAPSETPAPTAADLGDGSGDGVRMADLPQAGAQEEEDTTTVTPRLGTPVKPLTERDTAESAAPTVAGTDSLLPPFEANSAPSKLVEGQPYMSIILIEEEGSVGAEALADFPYPLTFAIDPALPDAAERMAARRAAGFEVMVLADLPRSASAQDAETALPVWLGELPGAMGILEGVETGVQGNRPLASQVAALARDMGYGLVMQDKGLNTVQKLAHREGVPSGVVFRDFDGAGQDPRAIRRFLDQAAFRAGQEGAVLMLGRLKPDTISALLMWGLQDRASRVALMPTSASLRLLLTR
ncbi:Immunoglobulin A1 protease autotransporter precursor [Tritonibacter multivorans]|uniref:Immunoglobulin A1 protease autotransporter n=1 Tax=Tritonibacter multivorans TaxID=928856 RepID=A0A0P1GJ11_9RHOB|nr:divergent polysaccharide deacetylase family protein [Tritonibacter multivorans]CUH81771.1 Immunoglobulin A1 protease autotransporter precursor [Tritonibacter multivorans]SFC43384.1 Uncharacterized conserved protein YibQ, putative polysaccharide deacetylase 2 family [Tritonibacter multivorans]